MKKLLKLARSVRSFVSSVHQMGSRCRWRQPFVTNTSAEEGWAAAPSSPDSPVTFDHVGVRSGLFLIRFLCFLVRLFQHSATNVTVIEARVAAEF